MARVRLFGTEFDADPLYEMPDGWMMRSHHQTNRCAVGTTIFVRHSEIVEWSAAQIPAPDPEAAMATERETLPSFAEIDAKNGNAGTREARQAAYSKAIAVLTR
jgi:hypothetical protein